MFDCYMKDSKTYEMTHLLLVSVAAADGSLSMALFLVHMVLALILRREIEREGER